MRRIPLSDDAVGDDPEGEMQAELSARTELAVPADAEEVDKTSQDSGSSTREIATEEKDSERDAQEVDTERPFDYCSPSANHPQQTSKKAQSIPQQGWDK
ncbi:hypothetical protein NQZ68_015903 [Dissostichus eleginoides]|nr:hypothetical protein NQZ68_015903 [Dissostichus eleginoides]